MKSNDKGIALVTVILLLVVSFLVGIYAIYMATKGLEITGGVRRYTSAQEAAQGGIDIGIAEIERAFSEGDEPQNLEVTLGDFKVNVSIARLYAAHTAGGAIEFSSGYEGLGKGSAGGGTAVYYKITSIARGPRASSVEVEALYKKTIHIRGG